VTAAPAAYPRRFLPSFPPPLPPSSPPFLPSYQHMRSRRDAPGSASTGMQQSKTGHSSARYLERGRGRIGSDPGAGQGARPTGSETDRVADAPSLPSLPHCLLEESRLTARLRALA
jgi:hypothetical protein